jgi:hypothetical protein
MQPGGTVTIAAAHTVCVITLLSGKGSCNLTASQLAPDTYKLVASYGGTSDLHSSASVTLTGKS